MRLLCTGTVVTPALGHDRRPLLRRGAVRREARGPDRPAATSGAPKAQTLKVNRAVVHKTYFNTGIGYDVALFHTMGPITAPVSTARGTVADDALAAGGQTATAVGWGLTQQLGIVEPPAWRAKPPPARRTASTSRSSTTTTCASTYADFLPGYFVAVSDMCAGTAGKNVCTATAAGRSTPRTRRAQLVQIGITSRGAGCATKLFPAIFTEVRSPRLGREVDDHQVREQVRVPVASRRPDFPDFPPLPSGVLYIC